MSEYRYQDDLYVERMEMIPVTPAAPVAPQKKSSKARVALQITALAIVCTLIGGAGGLGVGWLMGIIPVTPEVPTAGNVSLSAVNTPSPTASPYIPAAATTGSFTLEELYEECSDSVVAIECEVNTRDMFGRSQTVPSSGSGFVVSSNGYILTNYHVIENAATINAVFSTSEKKEAVLIGYESDRDVAILKVEGTGFKALRFGNSDDLKVGTPIAVIGNPLGTLAGTMTAGIVSGMNRDITINKFNETMIQIDAAVSPGNSGGPMFNMKGEVVGIVTAKSNSSGAEGIGFVLPSNAVSDLVDSIMATVSGSMTLGISIQTITADIALSYDRPMGLYVMTVSPGGNAARAGVKAGDIIIGFNGKDIKVLEDLKAELDQAKDGDNASITIDRSGTEMTLTVKLVAAQPMAA